MAEKSVRVVLSASTAGFVQGMRSAATATENLAERADKLTDMKGFDHLQKGALAIGAAMAGVAVAGVKTWMDFDQQMANVAATGEEATAAMDGLRKMAQTAGADIGFSATQSAVGMEELLKAGVSTADVMSGALTGALNLAAAGQMDVGAAAEIAATAMTQFKLEGKDVGHIADLLAAGAGKAQGSVEDMGMALKQGGLVASAMGLSIEETAGSLTAFAAAGLIGSDAGTSMKTMLQRLANPSKEASEQMAALGIAAYDAQGNFVGMESVAGQLKASLSKLPQAQRDAAMATIFGSDAVRAANVLYEQGAEGIRKYIDETNDAGYAAAVAAEKQNNLRGDLMKLKAQIDKTFIAQGDAAGGGLRDLTQQLTEFMAVLGRHPEAVGNVAKVTAALVGLGVGALAVIKTVQVMRDLIAVAKVAHTAMVAFAAAENLKAGLAGMNHMLTNIKGNLKGIGIGAAAVGAAFAIIAFTPKANIVPMNDWGRALKGVGQGATGAATELDKLIEAGMGSMNWGYAAADQVHTLTDAFRALEKTSGVVKSIGKIGNAMGEMLGIGMDNKWTAIVKNFRELDGALSKLDPEKDAGAFAHLAKSATEAGISADTLTKALPQTAQMLRGVAAEVGVANLSAQDLADWMGGKVPPAVQAAGEAASAAGKQVNGLTNQTKISAAMAEEAAKQHEAMSKAFFDSANAALAASGSQIGLERALRKSAEAIKELTGGGKTKLVDAQGNALKGMAEKAWEGQEALDDMASAALTNAQAMAKAKKPTAEITASVERARASFIAQAIAMGYSKQAAENLANSYGLIPKDVKTAVTAPGAEMTKARIDGLNFMIRNLPAEKQAKIKTVADSQGYDAAIRMLSQIDGKTVNTYIRTVYSSSGTPMAPKGANQQTAAANGGYIRGPGTTTSDSILARLSDKEYVIKASSVARLGVHRLDHINRTGTLPGFATGGSVGSLSRASYSPPRISAPSVTVTAPTMRIAGGRLELANGYAYIHDIALEVVEDNSSRLARTGGR